MADDNISYDSMAGTYLGSDTISITGGGTGFATGSITIPSTSTITLPSSSTTYSIGGGGGAGTGYVYTSNGAGGSSWGSITTSTTHPSITVKGDAEFDGDIKVKGESLLKMLRSIEDRLAILHPNPELEEKWDNLKELRRQYEELEKDILEKEKIMKILKEK